MQVVQHIKIVGITYILLAILLLVSSAIFLAQLINEPPRPNAPEKHTFHIQPPPRYANVEPFKDPNEVHLTPPKPTIRPNGPPNHNKNNGKLPPQNFRYEYLGKYIYVWRCYIIMVHFEACEPFLKYRVENIDTIPLSPTTTPTSNQISLQVSPNNQPNTKPAPTVKEMEENSNMEKERASSVNQTTPKNRQKRSVDSEPDKCSAGQSTLEHEIQKGISIAGIEIAIVQILSASMCLLVDKTVRRSLYRFWALCNLVFVGGVLLFVGVSLCYHACLATAMGYYWLGFLTTSIINAGSVMLLLFYVWIIIDIKMPEDIGPTHSEINLFRQYRSQRNKPRINNLYS